MTEGEEEKSSWLFLFPPLKFLLLFFHLTNLFLTPFGSEVWGGTLVKGDWRGELAQFLVDQYCGDDQTGAIWTVQLAKADCSLRDFYGFPRDLPFPHAFAVRGKELQFTSSSLLLRPPPLQEVILSRGQAIPH